jgi:ribonucleoside-diphosphate reductase alpha chain
MRTEDGVMKTAGSMRKRVRAGRGQSVRAARSPKRVAGLEFTRTFSRADRDPMDEVTWEQRTAEIADDTGRAVFRQEGIEVPAAWSELATKIAVSKYFYGDIHRGTDPRTGGRETSVRQLVGRVVRTITAWGERDGYFADAESARAFHDDLTWLCVNQHGAFNSPVWFNVGLWPEYGTGEGRGQGLWAWDEASGSAKRAATQYERPQASACFIQSVDDTMEDIMRLAGSEALLFKYGSGTGSDLSTLRSTREKLSGGGRPSGPLSFLRVYDQVANVVKSGGKTRRAAKMNTLKDWHPDIEEFIEAKTKEERKAWALIEQGYDGSFNGEAYASVMYQNENLSVRASDEFMRAAEAGSEWWTRRVTDGQPCERKEARALLRKIAEGTWTCGDPGMQFDSTIHAWHTCKASGRQNSTNPCSEYLFLDNTACNLASLNLLKFVGADGRFDVARFQAAVRVFITAQDILVDNASYPVKEIAENSHMFRTLGLGYANLGGLLMSEGIAYDSERGRAVAGAITALMTGQAYEQSARMAGVLGAFEGYHNARAGVLRDPQGESNAESMLEVIGRHRAALDAVGDAGSFAPVLAAARESWTRAQELGARQGFRNAQVTVLAPTGTIGFLMDCDTTGIEPDIALVKYKTLAGGGHLKIVNRMVQPALERLGYAPAEVERVLAHIERYETVEDVEVDGVTVSSGLRAEHLAVFDCAFRPRLGRRSLSYHAHLRMMAAAQPFLSGAISKTVNLPNEATVEEIMSTYLEAWRLGLKAVAIYRDGSKRSAPLSTSREAGGTRAIRDIEALLNDRREMEERIAGLESELVKLRETAGKPVRRRMPDTRVAINHKFEIAGHKGYLTVGIFDNEQPGEIFIQMSKEGSTIGGLMDTVATLTSLALQYGVPLESLVKKFAYQHFEPSGFTSNPDIRNARSITDYVFRWLGCQFIPGYKEATSPNHHQSDLPIAELEEMDRRAVNRPVEELRRDADAAVMPSLNGAATHADRVKEAIGNMFMDTPCSNCGSSKVIRAGACGVCTDCGTSQGCS